MLPRLRFLLSYFIFWILFFEAARLAFLLYNYKKAAGVSLQNKALSFVYGLRMDVAVASYILLPVCLLVVTSVFFPWFRKAVVYKVYSCIAVVFAMLVTLADLEVYNSWGFRLDATPLKYLDAPKEVWASISHLPLLLIFLLFTLTTVSVCLLLVRFINKRIYLLQEPGKKWLSAVSLLLLAGLLIIPMRGGLQLTPMNQSMVYFSKENFANVTAINATWNFMHGLSKGAPRENPYQYLPANEAKKVVDSLYHANGNTVPMLKHTNPNIILIIWESFTKKALTQSVATTPITPRFMELVKEGIYFSDMYSSGDRTDKGVAAVLSGYPAMNNVSIIRFPQKSGTLPNLPSLFKNRNYTTSFYYGGETEFANIKSFLLQSRYDKLTDKNDFSSSDQNSKWGAHDGVVAERIIKELSAEKQPFFTTWLTLSSHEPFETPVAPAFPGKTHAAQFASSLHYSDQTIFDFVQTCKQQPWWDNTLIVIIADHGHTLLEPSNWLENFRIPMLWLGGALKEKGIEVSKTASQIDLAQTLAAQVGEQRKIFPYSKNIFDSTSGSWAYFSFNNGFGFAQPQKSLVFDNVGKQVILQTGTLNYSDLQAGKAMQQLTFQDYIDR